ncbi:MAG: hypothetical protein A2Y33_14365 [Spirochaetes bacterium GWF1_51_8]|nr:MAG: hypothetical protein A2Y33_14365 [Spirochaetes bacterium GWF1_51_8]
MKRILLTIIIFIASAGALFGEPKKLWEFQLPLPANKVLGVFEGMSPIAYHNGNFFAGSEYGTKIYCLNAVTGKKVWEHNYNDKSTGNSTQICRKLIPIGDYLYYDASTYLSTMFSQFGCIDIKSGKKVWNATISYVFGGKVVFNPNRIFTPYYYVMDAKTGKINGDWMFFKKYLKNNWGFKISVYDYSDVTVHQLIESGAYYLNSADKKKLDKSKLYLMKNDYIYLDVDEKLMIGNALGVENPLYIFKENQNEPVMIFEKKGFYPHKAALFSGYLVMYGQGDSGGTIVCIDLKARKQIWENPGIQIGNEGDLGVQSELLLLDGNMLLIINNSENGKEEMTLNAVDIRTGKTLWKTLIYPTPENVYLAGANTYYINLRLHIDDDNVYISDGSAQFYCFSKTDGKYLWKIVYATKKPWQVFDNSVPAVGDGKVVFGVNIKEMGTIGVERWIACYSLK